MQCSKGMEIFLLACYKYTQCEYINVNFSIYCALASYWLCKTSTLSFLKSIKKSSTHITSSRAY